MDKITTGNVECTVLYPTRSILIHLKYREEKLIGNSFSIFMPEQHEESIKQIKKNILYTRKRISCLESLLIKFKQRTKVLLLSVN